MSFFHTRFNQAGTAAIFLEASETVKSLDASPAIMNSFVRGNYSSDSSRTVGGGVVQDLSAFIASIYMRGLRWSYIPTTVLAMWIRASVANLRSMLGRTKSSGDVSSS